MDSGATTKESTAQRQTAVATDNTVTPIAADTFYWPSSSFPKDT